VTADVGSSLAERLGAVLPPDRFVTDEAAVLAYRHDRSGWAPQGRPSAVVFPESTAEVLRVVRLAEELRQPVVVRGAGTGLSGAATAVDGELVLSTERMNAILELSEQDELAVVQPGVITGDLDRAAGKHGLCYAPDPGSVDLCTIGGNIATNAGGLRCAKYGVTRDSVLGLDVVLADGTLVKTGRRTVKGVAGYDLTSLFVGSEGTLGVVVAATVRLLPLPAKSATVSAFFDDARGAARAMAAVQRQRVRPAVAELMDRATLDAVDAAQGTDLRRRGSALLLIQVDGAGAGQEAEIVRRAMAPFAGEVEATDDPEGAAALLRARRLALPSLEARGRVLIEDVAVPRSRLAEAIEMVERIGVRTGASVATVAHAADGNLHPLFVLDPGVEQVPDHVWAAADEVFQTALRLGGTLTGEHGVGLLKRQWLGRELGAAGHDLQRRVKSLFDPHGILNPGKAV
jgi:glycolate oxidase